MKNDPRLLWRAVSRHDLATLLDTATLSDSQALGGNTVYRLMRDKDEVLAIALADGQAIMIEPAAPPRVRRRRVEAPGKRPAKADAK